MGDDDEFSEWGGVAADTLPSVAEAPPDEFAEFGGVAAEPPLDYPAQEAPQEDEFSEFGGVAAEPEPAQALTTESMSRAMSARGGPHRLGAAAPELGDRMLGGATTLLERIGHGLTALGHPIMGVTRGIQKTIEGDGFSNLVTEPLRSLGTGAVSLGTALWPFSPVDEADVDYLSKPYEDVALSAGWRSNEGSRAALAGLAADIKTAVDAAKSVVPGFRETDREKGQTHKEIYETALEALRKKYPNVGANPLAVQALMAAADPLNIPGAPEAVVAGLGRAASLTKKVAGATVKAAETLPVVKTLAKPIIEAGRGIGKVASKGVEALAQGPEAKVTAAGQRVARDISSNVEGFALDSRKAVEQKVDEWIAGSGRKFSANDRTGMVEQVLTGSRRDAEARLAAAPNVPTPQPRMLTGQAYRDFMDKQRRMGRGQEAVKIAEGMRTELSRAAGMPINPAHAADWNLVSNDFASNFGESYAKAFDDLWKEKNTAGVEVDFRKGYVLQTYRKEMDAAVTDKFGHLALRGKGPEADAAWMQQTGMTRAQFDLAADALFPSFGHRKKGKRAKMSSLFLKWADAQGTAAKGTKGSGFALKRDSSTLSRAIPGTIDEKNLKLKQLLKLDFDPLETDPIFLLKKAGESTGRAVGSRRALNVMMDDYSYTGAKRNALDWDADKVLEKAGLSPKAAPDLYVNMFGRHFPAELAEELSKSIKLIANPEELSKAVEIYRKVHGVLAKYALPWPGYFTRNNESSAMRAIAHGFKSGDPMKYLDMAADILGNPASGAVARTLGASVTKPGAIIRGAGQAVKETAKTVGRGVARGVELAAEGMSRVPGAKAVGRFAGRARQAMPGTVPNRTTFDLGALGARSRDEVRNLVDSYDFALGTLGGKAGGSGIGAVPEVLGGATVGKGRFGQKIVKPQRAVSRMASEALQEGGANDDLWRLAVALDNMAAGDAPADVSNRIRQLFFNMDEFSKAERGAGGRFGGFGLRDLGLFYTWTRRAVPWGFRAVTENPALYHRLYKGAQIAGQTGVRDREVPEWMREQPSFVSREGGNLSAITGLQLPEQDALGVASDVFSGIGELDYRDPVNSAGRAFRRGVVRPLLNRASPFIRTFADRATGWDTFFNRPIEEVDSIPDTFWKHLPGLKPRESGHEGRVKVAASVYQIYRSLLPPLGRAMGQAGAAKRSGIGTWLISEFLPGKHYTYDEDLLGYMRGLETRRKWMDRVWALADDSGWISNRNKDDVLKWAWTPEGKETPFYDLWRAYEAANGQE